MVIMTPKSLLRHPRAASSVSELVEGGFQAVLADVEAPGDPEEVTRLLLCTGKIFYDLAAAPQRSEMRHVSIGRIEQLYGFPAEELHELVSSYPNLKEVVWAQEEPQNMGALGYIGPQLRRVIPREISLRPVARPERASPAEGRHKSHKAMQERIIVEALGMG